MERHPVDQAFMLHNAEQACLPVVTEIISLQHQLPNTARQDGDLVTARAQSTHLHIAPAIDQYCEPLSFVRLCVRRTAAHFDTREIDDDVAAANDNHGTVDGFTRKTIRSRRHASGSRDHEPRSRRCRWKLRFDSCADG